MENLVLKIKKLEITSFDLTQLLLEKIERTKSFCDIEFIYADTDSLHCLSPGHKIPEGLDIDATRLGAWKYESKFNKAKFLRQKCYLENSTEDVYNENPEYELKVTVSGMPKSCYPYVNFNNFKIGASYKGKLGPKNVQGGVVLTDVDFTIKK
mgnify:CR=1 FL=1